MKQNKEIQIVAKEIPLYNVPMMTDEMWNELVNKKSPCDLAGYTRDK